MKIRRSLIALSVLALLCPAAVSATAAPPPPPAPPCATAPSPAYAPPGQPPATAIWRDAAALGDWQPPACLGWDRQPTELVVAIAGTVLVEGGRAGLLARLGAVSGWRTIRYWSISRGAWSDWLSDASALRSTDRASRRPDFSAAELAKGGTFHFMENEGGLTGPRVDRLVVEPVRPDRLVLSMENVSPVRYAFLTMIEPGGSQLWLQLQRAKNGLWRYYGLARAADLPAFLPRDPAKATLNRAAALLRYLAGQPTDAPPPLAP